ncbi:MAG: 50S ribosomal protein L11 methyltransferase [Gammaproteobacteria bacterium]|jgi:ribosomal protein L11 methyltransferase|nr:50S ribosomal protein L11 methyltransferase [Gammaproteobacteria bacterium]
MPWLQLTLITDRERAPLLEAALENAGALAVTLGDAGDEPQLEPPLGTTPLWGQTLVTALFAADPASRQTAETLATTLTDLQTGPPRWEAIADQAWEHTWRDDFAPTRFGERLWVCPRGQRPPSEQPDAVLIELDPGLAFGTGHHPTTALCLRWLDGTPLVGARLIDYGCGSGILAIAALKLGAAEALAVDHDPQALEATHANAAENGVTGRLRMLAPQELPVEQVDCLVANILAGPLIELAPRLAAMVRPGGRLALSGLLADQTPTVAAAYAPWFELEPPVSEEEWTLLSGRRRSIPIAAEAGPPPAAGNDK